MEIGIGLPAVIPETPGGLILNWARRADVGPFSSLGLVDRLVYSNYSPLIALAGASGATGRIRLMTAVLLVPLYNTGVLAKELASLDALSNGRLTVGMGIGSRKDDFLAAPASFEDRGKRFERQIEEMKRIWKGERLNDEVGPIGPEPVQPGGPPILIGGRSSAALQRVARLGDGFISGSGGPAAARQAYDVVEKAWRGQKRSGKPRFVACTYYGFGPTADLDAREYIIHYYGFELGERMLPSIPTTPDKIKDTIRAYNDIGVDELILWPTATYVEQVPRMADLVSQFAP